MKIEKGKIVEVWNNEHNKVVKYRQTIRNNISNEVTEIETESLGMLMNEVRRQLNEWNKMP